MVRGISEWENKDECRDFSTMEEYNETILTNINNCAKKDDIIYFLGDFTMGGKENIYEFWKRLDCKNIHFIGGNHDCHVRKNTILKTETSFINAQSLFKSYNELLEKKFGNDTFVMCHYPLRTWHKAARGSTMLFGHCHSNLPEYTFEQDGEIKIAKTMDVGLDTHPEFRPYHLDEIRAIMETRNIYVPEHHKTNR